MKRDWTKVSAARRKWEEDHAEEIRENKRQYYQKNKHKWPRNEEKAVIRARQKKWALENPEKAKAIWTRANDKRVLKAFGLTIGQYQKMSESQNGKCAICGKEPSGNFQRLCVDHDHDTGRIRDLLCNSCNLAIGNAKEDVEILGNMIAYIEKWNKIKRKEDPTVETQRKIIDRA